MARKSNEDIEDHWERLERGVKIVSTEPDEILRAGIEYFRWCKENPIINEKPVMTGKNAGEQVNERHRRPFTVKGLCLHLGITQAYVKDVMSTKDEASDYYRAFNTLLDIVYTQNQELATIGVYSAAFVAKVLGMEKEDNTPTKPVRVEIVDRNSAGEAIPELSETENEILEKLQLENKILPKSNR